MPELTVIHIALLAAAAIIGVVLGWVVRGNRAKGEKEAMRLVWQGQLEAKQSEHERLVEQNKSLMVQNSQYQASNKDSKMRAGELSGALKEAFERRDELQRQIKEIRSNLESAVVQRDQLQSDMQTRAAEDDATSTALKRRDEQIDKLKKELDGWQSRVPPLVERFRARNQVAEQLAEDLAAARDQIDALESMVGSDQTRVEPVDPDAMGDGLDASNEPIAAVAAGEDAGEELLADDELEELFSDSGNAAVNDSDDAGSDDRRDDLKMIKGVGPAIEKTLNEMGIFRFDQIAEMSEYEIDRIAKKLKGFRSRIYREDWIGQARDLDDQSLSEQD